MAEDTKHAPKPTRRWVKPLLAVSLAVNLLVAGAVGGAIWRHSQMPERDWSRRDTARGGGDIGGFALLRALERSDRRTMMQDLKADFEGERAAGRARMQQLLAVLRASTLDMAQLDDVLTQQRDAGQKRQIVLAQAWRARIAEMSAEERRAYAQRLEDVVSHRKPEGRDHKK